MINRVFHFCSDVIFINGAYSQFDKVLEDRNFFYVFKEDNQPLKNIKFDKNVSIFNSSDIEKIVSEIKNNDLVFFHALSPSFYKIINLLSNDIKKIWFCFGYEVYNDSRLFDEEILYDAITLKAIKKDLSDNRFKLKKIVRPIYNLLYNIRYRQKTDLQNKLKTISKINFLACVFVEEFQSINRILNQKKIFFKFSYYSIKFMVNIHQEIDENKFLIQIGNSGTPTNNHLDVFDKLQKIDIEKGSLFIPLSYGEPEYIELVKSESKKDIRLDIQFLEELISLDDYNKILNQVNVAIFNTRRQQAVGNILALLYFGTKVFISEKSPVYDFLKREKILVFSYEKELETKNDILVGLSIEQILYNRDRLRNLFDEDTMHHELKQFIDSI